MQLLASIVKLNSGEIAVSEEYIPSLVDALPKANIFAEKLDANVKCTIQ